MLELHWLYYALDLIFQGQSYVMPILIILFYLNRKKSTVFQQLLLSYNILMLVVLIITNISYLVELSSIYYYSKKYEQDIFFKYRILAPVEVIFWLPIVCYFVFFILLLIKKLRQSVSFAIILFILQLISLNWERLVMIVSKYGDYLPSTWSNYYYLDFKVISILTFSLVLFLTFRIRLKLTSLRNNQTI
jgi:hypothetical protein